MPVNATLCQNQYVPNTTHASAYSALPPSYGLITLSKGYSCTVDVYFKEIEVDTMKDMPGGRRRSDT